MSAARQAKQQKNPGGVVACIKQLDWIGAWGFSNAGSKGRKSTGEIADMDLDPDSLSQV